MSPHTRGQGPDSRARRAMAAMMRRSRARPVRSGSTCRARPIAAPSNAACISVNRSVTRLRRRTKTPASGKKQPATTRAMKPRRIGGIGQGLDDAHRCAPRRRYRRRGRRRHRERARLHARSAPVAPQHLRVVGDHDDREHPALVQPAQEGHELDARGGVQRRGRLVEEDERGGPGRDSARWRASASPRRRAARTGARRDAHSRRPPSPRVPGAASPPVRRGACTRRSPRPPGPTRGNRPQRTPGARSRPAREDAPSRGCRQPRRGRAPSPWWAAPARGSPSRAWSCRRR